MASNIVITVGISGCGKSTAYRKLYPDYELIEPDLIRKELTGSVSDQSRNDDVFEEAYRRLVFEVKSGRNVYWSATNLSIRNIYQVISTAVNEDNDVTFTILVFKDSMDWKKCEERVRKDLEAGNERSDTCNIKVVDRKTGVEVPLIKTMSDRFRSLLSSEVFHNLIQYGNIDMKEI